MFMKLLHFHQGKLSASISDVGSHSQRNNSLNRQINIEVNEIPSNRNIARNLKLISNLCFINIF